MTQQKWQRFTEWPMAGASIVFFVAYAWEAIGDVRAPADASLQYVMWAVWVLFAIDYTVNLVLAKPRGRWFYRHIPDLLIVALPFLRPLRLLRLLALVAVLQRVAGNALRGRVVIYVVGSASLIVVIAALAVLDSEENAPGAQIRTFGDALWWAFVTITTVGYGDYTPHTESGRLVAVGLMIAGIALLGVVTATLASWFVERVQDGETKNQQLTLEHISGLAAEISMLRAEIAALGDQSAPNFAATPDDVMTAVAVTPQQPPPDASAVGRDSAQLA